ncbi:MAG: hypothetical protein FWF08_07520 [Oscillospiraceae bacterium]|nr:hypothetical protein [Oscillospiraceae bacterium]
MKKTLAVVLALIMTIFLGVAASAASDIHASGVCGAEGGNVAWTLYEEGRLVISGEGEMMDFFTLQDISGTIKLMGVIIIPFEGETPAPPWAYLNYSGEQNFPMHGKLPVTILIDCVDIGITSIVVGEGVTSIGAYAFGLALYENYIPISIPSSVTYIHPLAFTAFGDGNDFHTMDMDFSLNNESFKAPISGYAGSYAEEYALANGHEFIEIEKTECEHIASDWIVEKAAAMQQPGSRYKECTVCGELLDTEVIPQLTFWQYIIQLITAFFTCIFSIFN